MDLGGVDLCLDLHLVVLVSTNVVNRKKDGKLKNGVLKIQLNSGG